MLNFFFRRYRYTKFVPHPRHILTLHIPLSLRHSTPNLFALLLIVSACFMNSCYSEHKPSYIDFSKRVAVDQPGEPSHAKAYFRVAVAAMISAQETVGTYHQLINYIAHQLGREIQLVQRKTYHEINELIGLGQIDLAFICSGPYARGKQLYGFEALAMPEVRGSPYYQAYLIVNQTSDFKLLDDLRGKIFAFTDPDSNTGRFVPAYWLKQVNENPDSYFNKTIYTHSHDNSIMAVAMSLVDGATVNSQIWEYYHHRNPVHTAKTRVIRKSQKFGTPPVVVPSSMPQHMKQRIRTLLLNMHHDPHGKQILDELMIDRFILPEAARYDPILAMMNTE